MASEKGVIATEAPPTAAPPVLPPAVSAEPVAGEFSRPHSRKRVRETTPTSPTSKRASPPAREFSPTKIARLGLTAQLSSPTLTGAAALEDERRRREEEQRRNPPGISENPTQRVISDLMSGGAMVMSRPRDAPASIDEIALAAEAAKALNPVTIPQPNVSRTDISPPPSATSAHSISGADGLRALSSPAPMDIDSRNERNSYMPQPDAQMDDKTGTSLSYPGPMPPNASMLAPGAPQRGMSLPMSGANNLDHGSPSNKKHKCPYCETEFTRHHNLKSHMLTHSQEKPFVCSTCSSRFRRLHDLKRHNKLHTGEKPHVCNKCDRKFARGDALARHSKGAGGCAGRRSSMGSFGGDDDYDNTEAEDSAMAGVVYDGSGDMDMTDEDRRRLSLPAIKAQHITGTSPGTSEAYTSHTTHRTYPPAGPRPGASGGLYPPNIDRVGGSSGGATSPSITNNVAGPQSHNSYQAHLPANGASSSMYSQGITESPKPLSPAGLQPGQPGHEQARQRSPSLATQLQQQQFRRQTERQEPPGLSLPAPHGTSYPQKLLAGSGSVPDTQSLSGSSQGHGPAAPAGHPPQPAIPGAAHSRTSSGPSHGNSGDSASNHMTHNDHGLWTYIKTMEDKMQQLTERITTMEGASESREAVIDQLTNEVANLRRELADTRQTDTEAEAPAPTQVPQDS